MKKKTLPHSVGYYLKRLFVSMCVVLGIVTLASFFLFYPNTNLCANSISCIHDLSGHIDTKSRVAQFEGKKFLAPKFLLTLDTENTTVLGASAIPGEKHIYVDLPSQTLYAYQGKSLVMKTLVSSGKWHPTPDGDFRIWIKLRATRMTGGTGDDFYDLPNVPYVMFFANDDISEAEGFSLHGAYWHDNFGHPMSHGCVNMRIVDAKKLYDWADPSTTGLSTFATADHPGTLVTIIGTAPGEYQ